MQDLSTFNAVLKDIYLPPIRSQLNNATVLLSLFERDTENISGRDAVIPVHYGRNEGVGARPDGGDLPEAGRQAYRELRVPMKFNYGRITVTGPAIAASRDDAGAFARVVDLETRGLVADLARDINRQLFGDGTGLLAMAAENASGTRLRVSSTRHLRPGMRIDVIDAGDPAGPPAAQNVEIVFVDPDNHEIELASAVSLTAAHGLYRHNSATHEMMGLMGIVDDSDTVLQTVDRARNPWFKAHVMTGDGEGRDELTLELMQRAVDRSEETAGGYIDAIVTTYEIRRLYASLLQAQRRYVNTMELDGGWKALEYDGRPLVPDRDCPDATMFFLDTSTFKLYRMSDWDWMQEDGAILHRVSGKDAYEAVLYHYGELGCDAPRKNVRIDGIRRLPERKPEVVVVSGQPDGDE